MAGTTTRRLTPRDHGRAALLCFREAVIEEHCCPQCLTHLDLEWLCAACNLDAYEYYEDIADELDDLYGCNGGEED